MTRSRLLSRTVALVLVAAFSPAALSAPPIASAAPRAALASAGDSDGDGLDDLVDGCPAVASSNPTGCPSASRTARLRWLEGRNRLEARILSPEQTCASRARISLWRVRPDRDVKVEGANASYAGRRRFRATRRATYYVTVSPSYSSGRAECLRAVSRKVRVPRR
jgi:hypothetical protein